MRHVDILLNDWNAHQQRHVGTVVLFEGRLHLKDAARHSEAIESAIRAFERHPHRDGEDLLEGFARFYQGSVMMAVGPHEDDACDLAADGKWAMQVEDVDLADLNL